MSRALCQMPSCREPLSWFRAWVIGAEYCTTCARINRAIGYSLSQPRTRRSPLASHLLNNDTPTEGPSPHKDIR